MSKYVDAPFHITIPSLELTTEELRLLVKQWSLSKDKHRFVKMIRKDANNVATYVYQILPVDAPIPDILANQQAKIPINKNYQSSTSSTRVVSVGKNLSMEEKPGSAGKSSGKVSSDSHKLSSVNRAIKARTAKFVREKKGSNHDKSSPARKAVPQTGTTASRIFTRVEPKKDQKQRISLDQINSENLVVVDDDSPGNTQQSNQKNTNQEGSLSKGFVNDSQQNSNQKQYDDDQTASFADDKQKITTSVKLLEEDSNSKLGEWSTFGKEDILKEISSFSVVQASVHSQPLQINEKEDYEQDSQSRDAIVEEKPYEHSQRSIMKQQVIALSDVYGIKPSRIVEMWLQCRSYSSLLRRLAFNYLLDAADPRIEN